MLPAATVTHAAGATLQHGVVRLGRLAPLQSIGKRPRPTTKERHSLMLLREGSSAPVRPCKATETVAFMLLNR
jgi:hypothetical protein